MTRTIAFLALLASIVSTGCLQKDTTSTVYLSQDGSLSWVVIERNVRSDEQDPARRAAEERDYLALVATDQHGVAEAFRALGGRDVRTRLLRASRPYAVLVEAGFDSLTSIIESQLTECAIAHDVGMAREGSVTTWRLWIDVGPDGERQAGPDTCGEAFEGLLDALDVTIVLESGRFSGAVGFVLTSQDTAVVDKSATGPEALQKSNGRVEFSLSWTDPER